MSNLISIEEIRAVTKEKQNIIMTNITKEINALIQKNANNGMNNLYFDIRKYKDHVSEIMTFYRELGFDIHYSPFTHIITFTW